MSSSQKFNRNIKLFYIHQLLLGLSALWAPVIVIFQMQEIGLTLTQVLVGESIFAATIVLFEVPSGVFADLMGRKNTLIAGTFFYIVGITIFAFAANRLPAWQCPQQRADSERGSSRYGNHKSGDLRYGRRNPPLCRTIGYFWCY